jgi:hypothetical protein
MQILYHLVSPATRLKLQTYIQSDACKIGLTIRGKHETPIICSYVVLCSEVTGERYLDSQGIASGTPWEIWQNIMALGVFALGVMFIAYVQLRRIPKLK